MNLVSQFAALSIGLLCVFALGRAVLQLLVPSAAMSAPESWTFAFLLGAGGISLLMWWLSPIFFFAPAVPAVTITVGLICGCAWVLRRPPLKSDSRRVAVPNRLPQLSGLNRMCGLFIIVACGTLAIIALVAPLGWDGVLNFELKARLAFLHQPSGSIPLAYFSDASRDWSHPQYPLLLPLLETWLYQWLGSPNQAAIKILFPLFYCSLAAVMFATLRHRGSTTFAFLGSVGFMLIPAFAIGPGGATTGYADVPLAAFVFGAVSLTYRGLQPEGSRSQIVLASALSGLGAWTKREGMIFAACLVVGVVMAAGSGKRGTPRQLIDWGRVAVLSVGPALIIVPWWIFQRQHGIPDTRDFVPLTPTAIHAAIGRLPLIVPLVGHEFLRAGRWAAVWPGFAAITIISAPTVYRSGNAIFTFMVLAPIAIYIGAFGLSAWPNVEEHLATSLPRLLLPVAPLAWVATLLCVQDALQSPQTHTC